VVVSAHSTMMMSIQQTNDAHLVFEGVDERGALVNAEESGDLLDAPAGRVKTHVPASLVHGSDGR
jgi:hypothetical protein